MRWISFVVCLLIPAAVLLPDSDSIKAIVEYKGPSTIIADPGETISFAFTVRNNETQQIKLMTDLITPENWRLLLFSPSIFLQAGESDFYAVSMHIPHATKAGSYRITGRILDEGDRTDFGFFRSRLLLINI